MYKRRIFGILNRKIPDCLGQLGGKECLVFWRRLRIFGDVDFGLSGWHTTGDMGGTGV